MSKLSNFTLRLAIFALILMSPVLVFAVSEAACIFLLIEPGSRPGAMGHAYVAQVDDAFAGYWNQNGCCGSCISLQSDNLLWLLRFIRIIAFVMVVAVYWNHSIYCGCCILLESDFIVVVAVYWNHGIFHGCCSLLESEHLFFLVQFTGIRFYCSF